ncbi:hypothetical protein FQN54_001741 [Arachnomyces sp. PD_36]|nr:hypothetical protein FQN54_001741 [Arachnomyces sp. PD_36]
MSIVVHALDASRDQSKQADFTQKITQAGEFVRAWPLPKDIEAAGPPHTRLFLDGEAIVFQRRTNTSTAEITLPLHHWQLAKGPRDIEHFCQKYNLTLVSSEPQEAALMPSWPQAFAQYIFIAPPMSFHFSKSHTQNGNIIYKSPSFGTTLMKFASPFLFAGWTVSFGITQASKETAGWLSVLGLSSWGCLMFDGFGRFAVLPLLFQFTASLTIIIQRWRGAVGAVAYRIMDLHGCVPHAGLVYLQQGARSHTYKIFQSVSFKCAAFFIVACGENTGALNGWLAAITLAELSFNIVVATRGTAMVVSGDCLLVELSPRLGFLDSDASTPWKILTSFMGF